MIKRIEDIAVNKQREYLDAENKAYDELVKAGFLPQGYDFKRKKNVVFKRENEHKRNEHTEVYYFDSWQEAKKNYANETTDSRRENNNMEERLKNLYSEINFLLNHAPVEDDCTEEENEMYSDMANLKNSMEDSGYDI